MRSNVQTFEHETWLEPEEYAYPHGGQTRRGRAIYPDGKVRAIHAGIPDTYFSIPAHGRIGGRYIGGYVSIDDRLIDDPSAPFGLADSPTRGALMFHPFKRYGVS